MKWFKYITVVLLLGFGSKPDPITVWMIGDSTMSVKETRAYPETGWGMPFAHFFDSTVKVDNRAKNGRSTRTFREEGLWQPVLDNMQPGDYVIIQFGHNDEVPTKKSATTAQQFRANLEQYIRESTAKKANPVLLTPVARRKFDDQGKITGTHDEYAAIVREVAKRYKVRLIDMDVKAQALYQQMGPETSQLLFNYLEPGEHPNYPDGRQDDTHFSELGARKIATLVLQGMKEQQLPLADRIVKRK